MKERFTPQTFEAGRLTRFSNPSYARVAMVDSPSIETSMRQGEKPRVSTAFAEKLVRLQEQREKWIADPQLARVGIEKDAGTAAFESGGFIKKPAQYLEMPTVPVAGDERTQEFLRQQWYATLTPNELKDSNTRSTIEAAIRRGWGPHNETAHGIGKTEASEIVRNTMLSDNERIAKAKLILKTEITKEQERAILEAHNHKRSESSGAFTYSREELADKAQILQKAGFTSEQRRMLLASGIAAEHMPGATDTTLQRVIDRFNDEVDRVNGLAPDNNGTLSSEFLQSIHDEIARLDTALRPDNGNALVNHDQARALLSQLNTRIQTNREAAAETERQRNEQYSRRGDRHPGLPSEDTEEGRRIRSAVEGKFWQKLGDRDFAQLAEAPEQEEGLIEFVNRQFDTLYEAAAGKDPAQSPAFDGVNRAFQEAVTFLEEWDAGKIQRLAELFETRMRLLTANAAFSSGDQESMHRAAFGLRARGLLEGFRLDDGRVGSMFGRMRERLEDMRLKGRFTKDKGHITPEMIAKLQDELIEEQYNLTVGQRNGTNGQSGYSVFTQVYQRLQQNVGQELIEGELKKAIRRSVRSAYDILIVSQQVAVLAGRGDSRLDIYQYFSSPGLIPAIAGPDIALIEKWSLFNVEQEQLHRLTKDSLAREWIRSKGKRVEDFSREEMNKLGDLQFRTLFETADFYSSGWRVQGILDQMQDYFEHLEAQRVYGREYTQLTNDERMSVKASAAPKAEEFALFMRVRKAGTETEDHHGHVMVSERQQVWQKIIKYRPEEVMTILQDRLSQDELRSMYGMVFNGGGVATYGDFKDKYAPIMKALREEGFRDLEHGPHQIDFANMSDDARQKIDQALGAGEADNLRAIIQNMKRYIQGNNITGDMFENDYRFVDIYSKVLTPDDALLEHLEFAHEKFSDMISLDARWANDSKGDGLVRNMNDVRDANDAISAYIGFITVEDPDKKMEQAITSGQKQALVSGKGAEARVVRHLMVPYISASKIPKLLDALGIEKLPWRLPMTEIEKILGPEGHPLSQEKRIKMLDKLAFYMSDSTEAAIKSIEADETLSPAEKEHKIHQVHEEAEKNYKDAKRDLEVTFMDQLKQRGTTIWIFLILAMIGEALELGKNVTKPEMGGR